MQANAGDRKSIRAAEKAARQAEIERRETVISICRSSAGRRYLWDKLEAAHVFSTSFRPDPIAMAFAEGERNGGLQLLNDIIESCPEQFIQMMVESNGRRTTDLLRNERSRSRPDDADSDGALGEPAGGEESGRESEGYADSEVNGYH